MIETDNKDIIGPWSYWNSPIQETDTGKEMGIHEAELSCCGEEHRLERLLQLLYNLYNMY